MKLLRTKLEVKMNGQQMPNKIGRNDKGTVELPSTDHLNFF